MHWRNPTTVFGLCPMACHADSAQRSCANYPMVQSSMKSASGKETSGNNINRPACCECTWLSVSAW